MLKLREIDHVVLRVRDIAAMTKFYCEVLGAQHVGHLPIQTLVGLEPLAVGRVGQDLASGDAKRRQWGDRKARP